MPSISDDEIIKALICDDPNAYEIYTQAYGNRLFQYILARTKNPQDAEEINQDVLYKALTTWRHGKGSSLKSWLYMLARQAIADWAKKNAHRFTERSLHEMVDLVAPSTEEGEENLTIQQSHLLGMVQELLETLPPGEQQLFNLCFREDLTDEQVGSLLNIKTESVRTMRYRLIRKIKGILFR